MNGLKRLFGFTNFFSMITQICQFLSNYGKPNIYLVYINNFFINVKLFKYFKKHGIKTYNIAKLGLKFLAKLFIFHNILFKKNN